MLVTSLSRYESDSGSDRKRQIQAAINDDVPKLTRAPFITTTYCSITHLFNHISVKERDHRHPRYGWARDDGMKGGRGILLISGPEA
jgi:hypothetical protein